MKKFFTVCILFISMLFTQQIVAQTTKTNSEPLTFEELITPYVQQVANGVEKGVEFVVAETPIVIQQFLIFESVYYGMWLLIGILFLTYFRIILENLCLQYSKEKPKINTNDSYYTPYWTEIRKNRWLLRYEETDRLTDSEAIYLMTTILSIFLGVCFIFFNIMDFIKVTFFPKLYLVEKFIVLVT